MGCRDADVVRISAFVYIYLRKKLVFGRISLGLEGAVSFFSVKQTNTMKLTSVSHGIAFATPIAALNCSVASFQSSLDSTNITAAVYSAERVAQNGTFVVPKSNQAYTTSPENLPALCQVQVNVTTEVRSHYSFGLFLPDSWNHRFLSVIFWQPLRIHTDS